MMEFMRPVSVFTSNSSPFHTSRYIYLVSTMAHSYEVQLFVIRNLLNTPLKVQDKMYSLASILSIKL